MMPSPESLTPEQFEAFLKHLDTLLQNLPDSVPVGVPTASKYVGFLSFTVDADLQERMGCEIGAFDEQLKGIFGCRKARTTGDGFLPIDERGEPICAVVGVLRQFYEKYPNDAIVKKWAVDIALGAEKIYRQHGIEPESHAATGGPSVLHAKTITAMLLDSDSDSDNVATFHPISNPAAAVRSGVVGRTAKQLMKRLVVQLEGVDPTTKKRKLSWACVGSQCSHGRKGTPQEPRVLKHAVSCLRLPRDLREKAIAASKEISLGAQIYETESENSDFEISEPKRVKTQATLDPTRFQEKKRDEDQQRFQTEMDHAIMRLMCVSGMDPTTVDSDEWKELMTVLNPSYHHTPSSTFINYLIPKEAAFVRSQQIAELKKHQNITLTINRIDIDSPCLLDTLATVPVAGTTQPNAASTCVEKPPNANDRSPDWDW